LDANLNDMRRAVEALATGAGPVRDRLQEAEAHFGRAFERGEWRGRAEDAMRLKIGAELVEGGDENSTIAESIASLDEPRAVEIAHDMFRLFELVAGLRGEDYGWPARDAR
jgi:hypothetical protein